MASASSLAQWNSGRAEGVLETVEIDPQFGAALGFAQGAVVRTRFVLVQCKTVYF